MVQKGKRLEMLFLSGSENIFPSNERTSITKQGLSQQVTCKYKRKEDMKRDFMKIFPDLKNILKIKFLFSRKKKTFFLSTILLQGKGTIFVYTCSCLIDISLDTSSRLNYKSCLLYYA